MQCHVHVANFRRPPAAGKVPTVEMRICSFVKVEVAALPSARVCFYILTVSQLH